MSGQDIIEQLREELEKAHAASEYQTRRIEHYRTQLDFCERRAEKAERERDEARANYAFMVKRAADQKLDGYRELGARAAAAEERAEKAERERDEERHLADVRGEMLTKTERERDEARAERDARPDISAEDALLMEDARATLELPAYEHGPEHQDAAMRIARAIRAHAAKVKP